MMRLPYYLYTYQHAQDQRERPSAPRSGAKPMSALFVAVGLAWLALLAFAVFGQW